MLWMMKLVSTVRVVPDPPDVGSELGALPVLSLEVVEHAARAVTMTVVTAMSGRPRFAAV
jgi:hypothetical protein